MLSNNLLPTFLLSFDKSATALKKNTTEQTAHVVKTSDWCLGNNWFKSRLVTDCLDSGFPWVFTVLPGKYWESISKLGQVLSNSLLTIILSL